MAYMRLQTNDGAGATYLRVLADGLGTNAIASLIIHCSNGTSYNATVDGGTAGNYRSTVQTFTGLASGTSYSFWATGETSGGTPIDVPASSFSTVYVPPPDPDPSITSLSMTAEGTISATWNVSNASYMRSSNSMRVYLSGANNSTQHDMGFLGYNSRSFTSGLAGDSTELIVGATYTLWIYVFDLEGNQFGVSRSVPFSRPRPTNFSWTNPKSFGGVYNLTSSEWSAFLDRINEFRAYVTPALVQRNFNKTVSGGGLISGYVVPTASSFNAAINAINDMSPPIAPPNAVGSGQTITAFHFTKIRDSLNSIV